MKRIDKLILGLIFGSSFPILLFLIAVTIWFYFFQNSNVFYFVFAGLLTGLFIDLIYLKRLIKNGFDLPNWVLIGLYLFYSICIYGLFMGFPVFNLIMGMIAGYYFGKRILYKNISLIESKPIIRQVSFFTSLIMLLICISSGFIANIDNGVGKDLQLMFRLQFEITKAMIWEIILIGGLVLIIAQYFLTKTILIKTIKNNKTNAR